MSLIREVNISWLQKTALKIIKHGPKIRHVALIMDGHRRYSRANNIILEEGHHKGYNKLLEIMDWCRVADIDEVTVYAFSIDNFNRNEDEVAKIMWKTTKIFMDFLTDIENHMERGLCIRVFGNLELISKDLRQLMEKVVELSKHNTTLVLNVTFAYTARYDITTAVSGVCKEVASGSADCERINEELLSKHLLTNSFHSDPDLLIRTSGDLRLSDFLLWQTSSTMLLFNDYLWPELDFWAFFGALFYYQHHCESVYKAKKFIVGKKQIMSH